ncbi:uncharacterized protein LOC122335426 [Puntigrus tetrazona]|uniref:uncharacterized protein LOC122335426 n=1 Tax=Puntigrus tetrazona TaxID=1606681 RepID=UPI001C8ABB9B|nr:uncharacterized protein LOC122335426 [Puntigrus tetrazona]
MVTRNFAVQHLLKDPGASPSRSWQNEEPTHITSGPIQSFFISESPLSPRHVLSFHYASDGPVQTSFVSLVSACPMQLSFVSLDSLLHWSRSSFLESPESLLLQKNSSVLWQETEQYGKKQEQIEEVYRQDCDIFGMVVKMLVAKDPSLEKPIQLSLRENLRDIGMRCIKAMEQFIHEYDSRELEAPSGSLKQSPAESPPHARYLQNELRFSFIGAFHLHSQKNYFYYTFVFLFLVNRGCSTYLPD